MRGLPRTKFGNEPIEELKSQERALEGQIGQLG